MFLGVCLAGDFFIKQNKLLTPIETGSRPFEFSMSKKTIKQAYQVICRVYSFYNHSRFQEKLNGLSPIEYREKTVA
jgi:hypothetical protein